VPHDAAFWPKGYINELKRMSVDTPLLFFNRSDKPLNIDIKNSFSLQNSIYHKQIANQILVPYNILSLSHLPMRSFTPKPSISFVGYVPQLSLGRVRSIMFDGFPRSVVNNSFVVRRLGIRSILKHFPEAQIKARPNYGGARSLLSDASLWRLEFEKSISEADFVFCPRGDANISQRIYEAISAGRIPLVPKTNQSFPKCFCSVNHKIKMILINLSSSDVGLKVEGLWSQLDQKRYRELQREIRTSFAACLDYNKFIIRLLSLELNQVELLVENVL